MNIPPNRRWVIAHAVITILCVIGLGCGVIVAGFPSEIFTAETIGAIFVSAMLAIFRDWIK